MTNHAKLAALEFALRELKETCEYFTDVLLDDEKHTIGGYPVDLMAFEELNASIQGWTIVPNQKETEGA